MTEPTLKDVLACWMQAKEDERKAIEHRRSLDKMIQSILPSKDEGSISQAEGDYKVTVSYKLDRKLDTPALQAAWHTIPERAHSALKWKADLSVSAFRTLSDDDKALIAKFMTTKPASPTVAVEIKEKE
jgi:hypothetical protein